MLIKLVHRNGVWFLLIKEELLASWSVNPAGLFDVTTDGQHLILAPVASDREGEHDERLMDQTERDYDSMFRRLAQ